MAPLAPYQPQPRGRKRPYGELQYPKHEQPQYRSALGNIPAGAAIFENSICNRAGLGEQQYVVLQYCVWYTKVLQCKNSSAVMARGKDCSSMQIVLLLL